MKKILVTGGAGFVGSHLVDRLHREGNNLVVLDNLSTGSLENVKHLFNADNFEFKHGDVCNPIFLDSVDEIYNLACPASPIHYQYDPIQTAKTSFLGAFHSLGLAKAKKAKVLQASTSEVYGDPKIHPQSESYWGNVNPIGPRSCYDEGKRIAETLFVDYRKVHNIDSKIVRIFNTYGPNMDMNDGRVVSNFIIQALRNLPITIYGDGSQTRSFCYVDELVDGMIKIMDSNLAGPINLGNPKEFDMIELAELVLKLTQSKSKLIFEDLPIDDPKQRQPDITKAEDQLNWSPIISLEDGLKITIDYFKRKLCV